MPYTPRNNVLNNDVQVAYEIAVTSQLCSKKVMTMRIFKSLFICWMSENEQILPILPLIPKTES